MLLEDDHTLKPNTITEAQIEQIANSPKGTEEYNGYFGGDVFVCETVKDLAEIEGCDFEFAAKHKGRWPNMLDMPLSGDACYVIDSFPKFIIFLLCWNDAGGPVYYIPEDLWVPNVLDSVEYTRKFWESALNTEDTNENREA